MSNESPNREAALVVVTGMSGAGKTTVLRALDDDGFYCVDNLPPSLASSTLEVCAKGGIHRVALGIDVRVGAFLDAAREALDALASDHPKMEVIFLDASQEALVRRFSETRRPHPMLVGDGSGGLGVADGVRLERERLMALRAIATSVVDTTRMSVHDLRRHILDGSKSAGERMKLRVMSFGFKHGPPLDASVVFDVRFLDNPYFVPTLKEQTGNDARVRQFVLASPGCAELLDHLERLLAFALPRYRHEGKSYLNIAIGCTGGRHRSVAISNELARRLSPSVDGRIGVVHRDVRSGVMMTAVGPADVGTKEQG